MPEAREDVVASRDASEAGSAHVGASTTPAPVPSAEALRLAEAALDEVAPIGAVGDIVDAIDEAGVLALRYASSLSGYPDWRWVVTLSQQEDQAPTVLEVALLPGEGSLVAPDWVPWADRLADYLAAKEADDEDGDDADGDADDDFDDFDESDLGDGDGDAVTDDAVQQGLDPER